MFLKCFTIYGQCSQACSCDLHYVDGFSLTSDLVENAMPAVSEKKQVKSSSINCIAPRSRNNIDLQYSHLH